jgi:hypothetical protein
VTTVAPQPVRPSHRHSRLVTAVSIALLIAGLAIGLLLAFSSGGTAEPSINPAPTGTVTSVTGSSSADQSCRANPPQPC